MLRLIILLLLLANAGFYAWSQGYLLAWGLGPTQQSEPQRVRQQVRPHTVQVLPVQELRSIESQLAQAPQAPECLLSPMLADAVVARLHPLLDTFPAGSWSLEQAIEPARWILYMGPYAGVEQVARKRAELRQLGISFEALTHPGLEPGLSLGSFPSESGANQQRAVLAERGVRSARVVQERPELRGQRLLLPVVDDSLRPRLEELRSVLNTQTLRPCR
jgi:hypothetical protein